MEHTILEHRFVKHTPQKLEGGVLYISMECCTAIHLCCCGCGKEVVTPLSPTDWKLIFDGETLSLRPSIGSWTLPCKSHYVIDRNQIVVAAPWTDEQIEFGRQRDRLAKSRYYNTQPNTSDDSEEWKGQLTEKQGLLSWFLNKLWRN